MAAPRAVWKGFLKVGSVVCGVKLVGATSESSKIHFKILNREDGPPVKSAYVDEETGEVVDSEDQIKGYEVEKGDFIEIEPAKIKKLKLTLPIRWKSRNSSRRNQHPLSRETLLRHSRRWRRRRSLFRLA